MRDFMALQKKNQLLALTLFEFGAGDRRSRGEVRAYSEAVNASLRVRATESIFPRPPVVNSSAFP